MANLSSAPSIALLGHYGSANLGDEAIIQAARQSLGRQDSPARVIAISLNPTDTRQRHGIEAFPVRRGCDRAPAPRRPAPPRAGAATTSEPPRHGGPSSLRQLIKSIPLVAPLLRSARGIAVFLASTLPAEIAFSLRCFRFLRGVDLVLITGSGQFIDDWNGPWSFPFTLCRWAILSRLAGAKFGVMSTGAGPIDRSLSKWLYRLCLSLCAHRTFRDERSRSVIGEIGFRGECHVYPDLAHGLGTTVMPTTDGPLPVVGINPMPILDDRYWHTAVPDKTARYRETLTMFTATLMREGYPVFFYKTHPTDDYVIDDILEALRETGEFEISRTALVRENDTVEDLLTTIREADIVVATRFHGILLPYTQNVPAVAIHHHHKAVELAAQMGQADYTVDFHAITLDALIGTFRALEANLAAEKTKLREIGERQRSALEEQYGHVARLASPISARGPIGNTVSETHETPAEETT